MSDENKVFDEASINKPDDLYRHIEIFEKIPEDDWAYTIKLNSWDYSRSSLRRKREAGEDLKKIFKQAKRCAFKLRKQNKNLPSLKNVKDFDELKDWCIEAQKIKPQEKDGQNNSGKVDSPNEKSSETWYWKLYEKAIKAVIAAILDKVNPS